MTLVTVSWAQDKVPLLFMAAAAVRSASRAAEGKGRRGRPWGGLRDRFTFQIGHFDVRTLVANEGASIRPVVPGLAGWGTCRGPAVAVVILASQLRPFQRSGPCTDSAQRN